MVDGNEALDDLKEAFEQAKVWDPIIKLPTCHLSEDSNGVFNVVTENSNETKCLSNEVDVIRLMRLSSDEMEKLQTELQTHHNYPINTLFRLQGVEGIKDKARTRELILKAGLDNGSELQCRNSKMENTSKQ